MVAPKKPVSKGVPKGVSKTPKDSLKSPDATEKYWKKDPKDKYAPLLTLPPENLQFINNLIFKENKITRAIHILKNDYGIYKNYTEGTLRVYLHHYKVEFKDAWHTFNLDGSVHPSQTIPEELLQHLPAGVGDPKLTQWVPYSKVKVLLSEAVAKYDSMTELERLAIMQYDRVLKVLEYEKELPNTEVDLKGKVKPRLALSKEGRYEIELMNRMLTNIVNLQMDLGVRHKVEKAENHLHVNLDQHQQKLMKEFIDMQKVTEATTKALELITGNTKESRQAMIDADNDDIN